jgi:hypothetical protein
VAAVFLEDKQTKPGSRKKQKTMTMLKKQFPNLKFHAV